MSSMLPPPPKRPKRKEKVLDEDAWVDKLEAIIERDFFPEIPKLQSKLEWLRAVNSGNVDYVKQAQRNTVLRRSGIRTPLASHPKHKGKVDETDSVDWGTPISKQSNSDWDEKTLERERKEKFHLIDGGDFEARASAPNMTLDEFCRKYTGEDNSSFSELLEKTNTKIREKRDRLHGTIKQLEQGNITVSTDGYGTSGQPTAGLITWKHKPLNPLFFSQSGSVALTDREKKVLFRKGPEKQICHRYTRLSNTHDDTTKDVYASPSTSISNTPISSSSRQESARAYIKSPSPAPGVEESPFMTWGEIDGAVKLSDAEQKGEEVPGFRLKPLSKKDEFIQNITYNKKSKPNRRFQSRTPDTSIRSSIRKSYTPKRQ